VCGRGKKTALPPSPDAWVLVDLGMLTLCDENISANGISASSTGGIAVAWHGEDVSLGNLVLTRDSPVAAAIARGSPDITREPVSGN